MANPPGKLYAVLAYATFIGMIISYILNMDKKSPLANYHLRNMFGLVLIQVILMSLNEGMVTDILHVVAFGCWALSLVYAIAGEQKGVPWLSDRFQQWFSFF